MEKIPITVILPVKNEEQNLPHCLGLLSCFDQILVIDSGSTDRTAEIAKSNGAEVYQFEWNGYFPKKRNWVMRNLSFRNDWIFFLDADEYINQSFIEEVQQKIKNPEISGYWIRFNKYFMGKELKYGDIFEKMALFRVGAGEYEEIKEDFWSHLDMEVHEHPIIEGKCGKIKTKVDHQDYKGLEAYIDRHNAYSTWEARRFLSLNQKDFERLNSRQSLKYRLMKWGILPYTFFLGSYILKMGFMDGWAGYYFASYKFQYFLQIQTKIKELKSLSNGNTEGSKQSLLNLPNHKKGNHRRVYEIYSKEVQ